MDESLRKPGRSLLNPADSHPLAPLTRCDACGAGLSSERRPLTRQILDAVTDPLANHMLRKRIQRHERKTNYPAQAETIRARNPGLSLDGMAVVTYLFNHMQGGSRLANYYTFRDSMKLCGLPLLVVELAIGHEQHVIQPDGEEVLRVRSRDLLWHRERLINIGIKHVLQQGFSQVVWVDADCLFLDQKRWPWHVAAALRKHPVCQCFRYVIRDEAPGCQPRTGASSAYLYNTKGRTRYRFSGQGTSCGFVWAARAGVLEQIHLYDHALVGGGDRLHFQASLPQDAAWEKRFLQGRTFNARPCLSCGYTRSAPAYRDHAMAWARAWNQVMEGSLGYAELTIRALYHGQASNRHYNLRLQIPLRHQYDPVQDLTLNEDGCYEWGSDKPAFHEDVRKYFAAREEVR